MISSVLKSAAKQQLKGNKFKAIAISAVKWFAVLGLPLFFIILGNRFFEVSFNGKICFFILLLTALFFDGPLRYGSITFYKHLILKKEAKISDVFTGFYQYSRCFLTGLYLYIFILLWSLLLILPGILSAISYSQTWFILKDYDDFTPLEAITLSKLMLRGYKMEYFFLLLTFLGYFVLGLLTGGIAFIFFGHKMEATFLNFYLHLKTKQIGTIARFMHNCGKY